MHSPERNGDTSAKQDRELVPSSSRRILLNVVVLLILFGLTFFLQRASGAHSAAFGSEADEAAHYVTAVMVRDYIARGTFDNPIAFAKDFYLHYPRVAFGIWPPLFHLVAAVWMLAFGTDRISVMFLMALLTTIWAFVFYLLGRQVLGFGGGVISALLLVLLPVTQKSTSAVMIDVFMALTVLLAIGAYARYLESERTSDAIAFGVTAAVAFLVKYNAMVLALLPPLCLVITGRHYLWRAKSFWVPALVVPVIAGPWYVAFRRLVFYASEPGGDSSPLAANFVTNAKGMMLVAGPVVFVLAVIGTALVWANLRGEFALINKKQNSLYVVAAALVLSVFLFHSTYPLYEKRYLLSAVPALILLSWPTVRYMQTVLRKRSWLLVTAALFVLAAHFAFTLRVPAKRLSAYVRASEAVVANGLPTNGAVLVSADSEGEGMMTAEFVMHDRRPDHYILRASKVLASQTLMLDKYHLNYQTPEDMMKAVDSIPIETVVIQQCPKGRCGEHENVLNQTVINYPERWRLSSVVPSETGAPILIYQIAGNEGKSLQTLSIDMTHTLGSDVEKH